MTRLKRSEVKIPVRSSDHTGVDTSIVSVPGCGTPTPNTWNVQVFVDKATGPVEGLSNVFTYSFSSPYNSSTEFSWSNYIDSARKLAEDVADLATKHQERSIIFIAHSLGGVLLKQALLLAHTNLHDTRFKLLVDCLAGILFLGTPHACARDEETLRRHNEVLYACTKKSMQKQSPKLANQDMHRLAELSRTFELIATVPILSVYEMVPQTRSYLGRKSKAIVDEHLARISASAERTLGVELKHEQLCNLPILEQGAYSATKFLQSLLEKIVLDKQSSANSKESDSADNSIDINNPVQNESLWCSVSSDTNDVTQAQANNGNTRVFMPMRPRLTNHAITQLLNTKKARLPYTILPQYADLDFVGRDDVSHQVDSYFFPQQNWPCDEVRTKVFAVCGMAGLGKTDFVLKYAEENKSRFDAVFWVNAGNSCQLATDFGRIAQVLGLEELDDAQDLQTSIEIAKAWLNTINVNAKGQPVRWLLILDNADKLDLLRGYLPIHGNGAILITSRDPFAKDYFFARGSGIDLLPLSLLESATLLHRLTTPPGSIYNEGDSAALELAEKVDGLPLAITHIAGFIRRRHLTVREFLDQYDTRYAEMHNSSVEFLQFRYGYTLATAFNFQDLKAWASRLLQLLSFFHGARIREDIFLNSHGVDEEASGLYSPLIFESARLELLDSSIIKRDVQNKELWIHTIIQKEVRSRIDEGRRWYNFTEVVSLIEKVWPPGNLIIQARQRWSVCESLLPHIHCLYLHYQEYATAWKNFRMESNFLNILNETAIYLHERGLSQQGKTYLQLALTICKRDNITEEPLVSELHMTMGALSNETNDAESCHQYSARCIDILRGEAERTKKQDLRLAFAHNQMGIAHMMAHNYEEAESLFAQCIQLLVSTGADTDEFAFPVSNLASAYWIQGKLDEADTKLVKLLDKRVRLYGEMDKISYKTGRALLALGNVRYTKAEIQEAANNIVAAEELYDQSFSFHSACLQQYESTLGPYNHRTADACHKLAEHHIRRHEDVKAQEYLTRALSIWNNEQWFSNETARTLFLRGTHLVSFGNDAQILEGKENIARAKLLRREILSAKQENFKETEEEEEELTTKDFDKLVCFWSI